MPSLQRRCDPALLHSLSITHRYDGRVHSHPFTYPFATGAVRYWDRRTYRGICSGVHRTRGRFGTFARSSRDGCPNRGAVDPLPSDLRPDTADADVAGAAPRPHGAASAVFAT